MPRIPKPYPYKGWYRTNAGGKRGHPLCRIDEGMTATEASDMPLSLSSSIRASSLA